jgi:hypothetical protein
MSPDLGVLGVNEIASRVKEVPLLTQSAIALYPRPVLNTEIIETRDNRERIISTLS